jgi:succinate dehydrogenase / fumarate reductase cytochrome b subunit
MLTKFSATMFSSLGKKIFMALTGLALSGFIVIHLVGNIALMNPDKDPFNKYAHFLDSLGGLLYFAEIGLAGIFIIHFIYAIYIQIENWLARPYRYSNVTNAKHTSKKTLASNTMIYTGIIIIVLLPLMDYTFVTFMHLFTNFSAIFGTLYFMS